MNNQPTGDNMFVSQVSDTPRAVLYLFAPKRIQDHYKRPLLYNFNNEFAESLYDTVRDANLTGNFTPKVRQFLDSKPAQSAIMPSSHGEQIGTGIFSNFWTFMLLVDNDKPESNLSLRNTRNRTVYYGYCSDEPINPNLINGSMTVNEGAFLTITHKTIINAMMVQANMGQMISQFDTVSDIDVIHGPQVATLASNPLYLMTPSNIRKSTISDFDGSSVLTVNQDDIIQNHTSGDLISATLNSPKRHVQKIVNAIINGCESMVADRVSGQFSNSGFLNPGSNIYGYDDLSTMIDGNMVDNPNEAIVGVKINQPISMGVILRKYRPEIIPIFIKQANLFDPIPQSYISANNIFSSLLAGALPTVLSNTGICNLAFCYNSYHQAFRVDDVATFVPMNPAEVSHRVSAARQIMERELFSILISNGGHFDLMCSCSVTGDTHITLNFLDSTPTNDVYENDNRFANTQLVGNYSALNHNSANLGGMISSIANSLH